MQQVLTAKLKLDLSQEQKALLRQVCLAYRDSLNYTSQVAFANGQLDSGYKLQKLVYTDLRQRYGLPSQMACNVPRQVASTYKGLKTKAKQNAAHRKEGKTQKRYRGLEKPPKFVSRTCTLNYGRDYSFVKPGVSIVTLQGRIKVPYHGYHKHVQLIRSGSAKIGAAKIYYARSSQTYYLLVSLELEIPDIQPEDIKRVVGVDVGQRYLAVTTDTNNRTHFYNGKQSVHKAAAYQRARKSLQRKGTRSAKRRLVALSGRERRFIAERNHCIAQQIATPATLIGLEDLTHIRERTQPRRKGKSASSRQRQANHRQAKWSFAELHQFVDYKAILKGSLAIKVDADYTSQSCVCCGHTSSNNRPNKGLIFRCENCGKELHADLVGARNVALRTLLVRQDWASTGRLSAVPDGSSDETKAARLSRFAELRWTAEPSPACNLRFKRGC
ncbi:transposase [Geitlerinema sp. CS-897]|nr:transposase [Geitlerinema sp. CS-897]